MSNFQYVTVIGGYFDGTIQQIDIEIPYWHAYEPIKFNPSLSEHVENMSYTVEIKYVTYNRHVFRVFKEQFIYIYVVEGVTFTEAIIEILEYYGEKNK